MTNIMVITVYNNTKFRHVGMMNRFQLLKFGARKRALYIILIHIDLLVYCALAVTIVD